MSLISTTGKWTKDMESSCWSGILSSSPLPPYTSKYIETNKPHNFWEPEKDLLTLGFQDEQLGTVQPRRMREWLLNCGPAGMCNICNIGHCSTAALQHCSLVTGSQPPAEFGIVMRECFIIFYLWLISDYLSVDKSLYPKFDNMCGAWTKWFWNVFLCFAIGNFSFLY